MNSLADWKGHLWPYSVFVGNDASYLAFVARGSKIKSLQPAEYKAVNGPYMRLCVEPVLVTLNNWLARCPT